MFRVSEAAEGGLIEGNMNSFDLDIMSYLNKFSQHSWTFDNLIVLLVSNTLLKGGVLVTTIWWLWFKNEDTHSNRQRIMITLFSCIVAIVLARILALTLPFRFRPLHDMRIDRFHMG